jgi:GNAT superfamily N-acetyltransferase
MEIQPINHELANLCEEQFSQIGWAKPEGHFLKYCALQEDGKIIAFVAYENDQYIGHIKAVWKPDYIHFRKNGIPEIQDLNVLPSFRNRGVGTALIESCEQVISKTNETVGIGVGLHPGYNNAQRLYPKLGYVPDGNGVHYGETPAKMGESYRFDDDLVLYFTKTLNLTSKCSGPAKAGSLI